MKKKETPSFVETQNLWEQARTAGQTVVLEDTLFGQEDRRRRAAFSELLLRHLITGLSYH